MAMKVIEVSGKNIEEAKRIALKQLETTEDKVEILVLDEGSKGILGFIGTKPCKIKVTVKRDYIEDAKTFIRSILDNMGVMAEIRIKEENNVVNINLTGPRMGIIIGYRGETLDAIQYLVSLIINNDHETEYKRVVLDTENYRSKREETLKRLAEKTAYKT